MHQQAHDPRPETISGQGADGAERPALVLTAEQEREVERQLQVFQRGTAEIVPVEALTAKLRRSVATGQPLRLKLGMDPSSPDIHLGHTVVLQKIRQLQAFGHLCHLIIGDFTGRIGDPTGKSETRRQLSEEEVNANARTYVQQVLKVLDPARTMIVRNADWLAPLTFADVIRLAATLTVARMLEREDFAKRFAENRPIHIHEFFYPLMQAYDSVYLQTDVEFGGTDQKFNLLMGRALQREFGQEPQVAVMMPILEGLDGVQKMSKSLGNYIGIDEPPHEMWGKVMSIPDALMPKYYELLSGMTLEELQALQRGLQNGSVHPRDAKLRLAHELVARFHGPDAAAEAAQRWQTVFQEGALPADIPERTVQPGPVWIVKALVDLGLAPSNSEARRAIEQGGVRINGEKWTDATAPLDLTDGMVIQLGKRKFVRCRVK
ncbi:MAG: tyrosine--tRNA ligase [Alicyclobacillus sp.]|nr:tyrosine--tRNA ligase [Alicyclobacillus sp.]